jgi:predicted phosphohydrolase
MKLAWLTDIHLNFLEKDKRENFYQEIIATKADAILITGDIAEASSLSALLEEMAAIIKKDIYFVLGNHDYYSGGINEVRNNMEILSKTKKLFWLPTVGIQTLNPETLLIGQDGWADGRLGDYHNSRISLNDSRMIVDLFQEKILGKSHLLKKMQELADFDAIQLEKNLTNAIKKSPKKIIILTHVPPFKEACCHEGKISDENWLPYFSSKVSGDILEKIAADFPSIEFLTLCGHTHSESFYQPLPNLIVKAGKAKYFGPIIQEIITI